MGAAKVLVDGSGSFIGTSSGSDGQIQLHVKSQLTASSVGIDHWLGSTAPTVGQKAMSASLPVTLASNQPAIQVSIGHPSHEGSVTELLTSDGTVTGSVDMVISGSGTQFWYPAHPTLNVVLTGIRIVFSAAFFDFGGASFGKGGGPLSNGVEMKIVANSGSFVDTLAVLNVNEDFFRLLQFSISQAGTTDVMAATLPFGGRVVLEAGTSDRVELVINDDLTAGSRGISYFTSTVYGVLEV
jgi:hypothetical protein